MTDYSDMVQKYVALGGIPVDDCEAIGPGAIRKNGLVVYGPCTIKVAPELAEHWARLAAALERMEQRPAAQIADDWDYDVEYEDGAQSEGPK